ncbi:MAG: hypothetical protein KDA79_16700, partial [Planctomycetaceae bacterium]|nr:hypothetical protein [Planctomycetaceae bacterium]
MRIAFFEDRAAAQLTPLSQLRPVSELLCGQFSTRERLVSGLQPGSWGLLVRPHLAEVCREEIPQAAVNDPAWLSQQPVLLINGRWLAAAGTLRNLPHDGAALIRDTVVALWLDPLEAALLHDDDWQDGIDRIARTRTMREVGGTDEPLVDWPWDLVNHNPRQLEQDFETAEPHRASTMLLPTDQPNQVEILGNPNRVRIDATASLEPFVVIDARQGPVTIGPEAQIQAFTRLEGPCHIGRHTRLFRANVRAGTTFGPHCRGGGEFEQSILHGFANSYHDGFLGHAYVCPWTNLGALTTNSDLRNDYGPVRVPLAGTPVDSGSGKVGCFIGDHTKTALCSLFNTGSSIGVMCMVLPGGELLPKHIPSFSRVWHGSLQEGGPLEPHLETARLAMSRRNHSLT